MILVTLAGGPFEGRRHIDRFRAFLIDQEDSGLWAYYRLTWRVDTVPNIWIVTWRHAC